MHEIRWLDLTGVDNMRDVGGIPTHDGTRIATGRLLRSDDPVELTDAAITHLVERVGVTDVVDLRTHVEVAREGRGALGSHPRVRTTHLTLYADDVDTGVVTSATELPWVIAQRRAQAQGRARFGDPSVEHHEHWAEHYLGYLAARPDSVVAALRAIAAAEGAVLVHCAAGKDRTGAITALALTVADAEREHVIADYTATAERLSRVLDRLRTRPAYAANLAGQTLDQQLPRAQTMRALLQTLDSQHGGALSWLAGHGWTAADTAALRGKLRD